MMSERKRVLKLAHRLLDVPYADPDDDVRTLARELVRAHETIDRLKADFAASYDPMADVIQGNRDAILKMHEEAVRQVRKALEFGAAHALLDGYCSRAIGHALAVLNALNLFHPMHGESWAGWPIENYL